ncbi:putative mitochondrial export translocase Oxa2 [Aspergillus stella-maris]|uniref:putative mitochondrial export translocase Oxa2 n=1 Tax=Aspergillus stella-maris TaxID=1810926 RepID=UPI003CCDA4B0
MRVGLRQARALPFKFQQVRRFHPTKPAPFVGEVLGVASGFIYGVHTVSHLPWVFSLPLTAFIVRMVVALPLQMFVKVQARKAADITPLQMAWRSHYQDEAARKAHTGRQMTPSEARRMVNKQGLKKHAELRSRWGLIRGYGPMTFLQLPVWITIMESIRAMSGINNGLVPWLLSLISSSGSDASATLLPVEPTLATEGALWFPDLLAGDPTGVLSALLTVSILTNIRSGWKTPSFKSIADMPREEMRKALAFRFLKIFIQVLSLNVGLSSYQYQMPAALIIYWITSTNIATLQTALLQKYMFPYPSLKPFKRVFISYSQGGKGTSKK